VPRFERSPRRSRSVEFCGSLRAAVPGQGFLAVFREFVGGVRAGGRWRAPLVVAVALLGLSELGFHVYFSRSAPSLEEWGAVQPLVSELAGPGTLIVVAPEWAEPNARFALGSKLMPLAHVARPDESSFERALEVAILGESTAALGGWRLEGERRAQKFSLRSWTNPNPARVLYDFLAHIEPNALSVEVQREAGPEPCPYGTGAVSNGDLAGHPTFPRRRFSCPGAEWSFVGVTVIEDQNYRPRQCVWAHPSNRGTLALRFSDVPLGTAIVGYGGLPYFFEREWRGTPIELEVLVAGQALGTWKHADGEGWKRFEFSTEAFSGQRQPVEFRVRSRQTRSRQFCFQASAR
jgi:hypothetical protein